MYGGIGGLLGAFWLLAILWYVAQIAVVVWILFTLKDMRDSLRDIRSGQMQTLAALRPTPALTLPQAAPQPSNPPES